MVQGEDAGAEPRILGMKIMPFTYWRQSIHNFSSMEVFHQIYRSTYRLLGRQGCCQNQLVCLESWNGLLSCSSGLHVGLWESPGSASPGAMSHAWKYLPRIFPTYSARYSSIFYYLASQGSWFQESQCQWLR